MDYPVLPACGAAGDEQPGGIVGRAVNERVQGPQKHGNRPEGAEWILHVHAAVLSEDDPLARHFAQRAGNPYRRKAG